jgi:hypothetical protein
MRPNAVISVVMPKRTGFAAKGYRKIAKLSAGVETFRQKERYLKTPLYRTSTNAKKVLMPAPTGLCC